MHLVLGFETGDKKGGREGRLGGTLFSVCLPRSSLTVHDFSFSGRAVVL